MTGDGRASRDNSPAPKAGSCIHCNKLMGKKLFLQCSACNKYSHLPCLDSWKDVTSSADLDKIMSRSGLMWYCHICIPTLPSYIPAAGVREAFESIDKKLENVTKMIASTNSTVKSYAQAQNQLQLQLTQS